VRAVKIAAIAMLGGVVLGLAHLIQRMAGIRWRM